MIPIAGTCKYNTPFISILASNPLFLLSLWRIKEIAPPLSRAGGSEPNELELRYHLFGRSTTRYYRIESSPQQRGRLLPSISLTHSHTHSLSYTLTLTHTHSHTHSLSHTLTLTHTHSHALTHTLSHKEPLLAFCELKYFSKALSKATAANIILPDAPPDGPLATFYLLHGLSDDHTIWQRRTSLERYVQNLPLMVVMPDGGRGFYCDARDGMAWETAIVGDLLNYIDAAFHTRASREGRCIAGLSMGGYGAVKLALKYPHLFCSSVSHSGAVAFAHRKMPPDPDNAWAREWIRVVGEDPVGGPDDIFALADRLAPAMRPALRIDCGTEDFLIEDNRALHAHLNDLDFPHEYAEHPGGHSWEYWDLHIQDTIAFHARNLGLE